jgi:excisionase family DNA binding protein
VEILTTAEAARLLRVHPATIRRMVHRGELDGVARRSLGRVTRASVERLLGGPWQPSGDTVAVADPDASDLGNGGGQ